MLSMAIGLVGAIIQARFISPEELGYFRGFSIAAGYALFLHLGFFEVVQRLYPYYIGKGEKDKAIKVVEICQSWNILVSAIISFIFLSLAIICLIDGNWYATLAWLVQVVAIMSSVYGGYLSATYRSGHEFNTLARGTVISTIFSTVVLPLFFIWPYIALTLRSSLGSLMSLIYLHFRRPLRLKWRINWREWRDLLKIGLPLFILSYSYWIGWDVVEKTIILKQLGAASLGLWSMSFMLFEASSIIPKSISAIYRPRLIESFGRTGNAKTSLSTCGRSILAGSLVTIIFIAAIYLIVPILIPFLMPQYVDAIPAMKLMILGMALILLDLPYSLLVAAGKLKQMYTLTYAGFGVFLLLALLSGNLGLGLMGIIGASIIGKLARISFLYYFVFSMFKK